MNLEYGRSTDIPSHMYNAGCGVGKAEEHARAVALLKQLATDQGGDLDDNEWCWCVWIEGTGHTNACQAAREYVQADAESAKPEGGNK